MGNLRYFSSDKVRLIPVLATMEDIFRVVEEKKTLDLEMLTFNPE
jgi:hypothetical protein